MPLPYTPDHTKQQPTKPYSTAQVARDRLQPPSMHEFELHQQGGVGNAGGEGGIGRCLTSKLDHLSLKDAGGGGEGGGGRGHGEMPDQQARPPPN